MPRQVGDGDALTRDRRPNRRAQAAVGQDTAHQLQDRDPEGTHHGGARDRLEAAVSGQPVGAHLPLGQKQHGDANDEHPARERVSVALGHPRPGDGRDEGGQSGGDQHAARGQAGQGPGRGLVPRGGQDDAEVEAGTRDGGAERRSGREDTQIPQVRVRVEAGNADLGDEGDDLGEEGAAEEGEHLREDARAGGAGRCVRHGLI